MKKILSFCILIFTFTFVFAQHKQNVIKPIGKSAFVVDSILSMKGNAIDYLLAGTEFDIPKENVEYVEHSVLGRIAVSVNTDPAVLPIPEPEFYGDAFVCNLEQGDYIKMEKAIGQIKTKDQFWGLETKLYIKPSESSVRVEVGRLHLLVKVPNINDDPYAFIKVSKFSVGVTRKLSLSRLNELTGKVTYGGYKDQELPFSAKKYGSSSFLLDVDLKEPGEYCITISNPNKIDGKISVSCFGAD